MTIDIQRGKAVTVERGKTKVYAGQGLLRGLGVIWRHWVASFGKNDSYTKIQGTFTVEYPEERRELPEAYRNMPILLYDDATGHELCTSCFQCQRICPPQVIHMTQAKDPTTGKAVPAVAEFVIEYDACMSCGFCAEICPFDAIKMDQTFELSTSDHPSLTVHKEALNRPISYYERIAPRQWAEVKEGATKKLTGNMRRRSGSLGIAPQVADARQQPAASSQQSAASSQQSAVGSQQSEGAAGAPASADDKAARLAAIRAANAKRDAAQPAEATAEPVSAEDKAARLAAIRAANAAKKAAEPSTQSPVEQSATAAPADDKAARLAAIRAANAAKKAAEPSTQAPVEQSATAAPADDKAARLAAIRAANAAKKAADGQAQEPVEASAPVEPIAEPATPGMPADDKAARLAAIRAANAAKKAAAAAKNESEGGDA